MTASTPEVLFGLALVDLGWASKAFLWVLDLSDSRILAMASPLGLPRLAFSLSDEPWEGLEARFRAGGLKARLRRVPESLRLELELDLAGDPDVEARIGFPTGSAEPLSVIAPVTPTGWTNCTQKLGGLPASGHLRVARHRFDLSGGVGGLDLTAGYLARRTTWRWAMANGRLPDGRPVGFNLVEGFNDQGPMDEGALWVDGRLHSLPRVRFPAREELAAEVRSLPGDPATALDFRVLHRHSEKQDLGLAASDFEQRAGIWSGRLPFEGGDLAIDGIPGVLEHQDVRW